MKKIIQGFFGKKKLSSLPHILYSFVVIVFAGVCLYEGILYLVSKYTFLNALYVFFASSIVYGVYNSYLLPARAKKQLSSKVQKIPVIGSLLSSKVQLLYTAFLIVSGVFLYSFYFSVTDIFKYVSYIFVGVFLLFTILGERIDIHNFGNTDFSQKTLLKIGVITLSIYLVFVSSLIELYGAGDYKNLVLLVTTLVYILGFLGCFTDAFQRIYTYFLSRKFQSFALRNTYNFLSFFFISVALILLLGKFGAFDGVKNTLVSYFSPPVVIEQVEESIENTLVQEVIPEPVFTTELVSDIFDFGDNLLQVGSDGEDVAELQNALTLLGSFTGNISGEYGEDTKASLTQTLQQACDWPESTQGILGAQARQCIYSLSVQVPEGFQDNIELISDEVVHIVEGVNSNSI